MDHPTPIEGRYGPISEGRGGVRVDLKNCDLTYVGETARNLGKHVSKHRGGVCNGHPDLSAAAEHMLSFDHHLDWEHPRIIEKDANTIRRRIKEALAIHTRTPMNRDKSLELSKLWLRGAWRDRDTNDIFAHCSLIFYFLDFKFSNFVCPSQLHPLIWFFSADIPSGKEKYMRRVSRQI